MNLSLAFSRSGGQHLIAERYDSDAGRWNLVCLLLSGTCKSTVGTGRGERQGAHKANSNEFSSTGEFGVECARGGISSICIRRAARPNNTKLMLMLLVIHPPSSSAENNFGRHWFTQVRAEPDSCVSQWQFIHLFTNRLVRRIWANIWPFHLYTLTYTKAL